MSHNAALEIQSSPTKLKHKM